MELEMKVPTIVKAIINKRVQPHIVTGVFSDNTPVELFHYYSDEISFDAEELVGLTRTQAVRLKFSRDVEYLQS
jgi:hypothetical protein